ncbi:BON domain-containing protein [Ralstonia pseudosolanacearum]|uniref:BON domain-containing protein n=2 Tax=Ralstonia pseudosolanacearum TaxID=1310165 RepID=UPI002675F9EA|nr:BON domain-containing protein [Ralstonia pseudosolanacearum]MDO3521662.1 BON domain-containing protein [Ralstonia pseudosolanacearum]MDO3551863.1 BON domain-containing protein [Ralstonia pseudosolanacearum]MDO3595559.1 BON domain-containing protein [Ralstonia pseudosolanacearum]MDO3600132.1 BON domain-containing protein [Ralstonia pseudosolanacearum]
MFVEAKNAQGAVAVGKGRPGLSQSLAWPARRIGAHGLGLAICMAMPVAFAQMPPASGPSGVPGRDLRNGVSAPFVQISQDVPDCPVPRGPLPAGAQARGLPHDRIERGNNCCHPGGHVTDPEIAGAAQQRLRNDPRLRDSTLWIAVQDHVIALQGCAASARQIDYVAEVLRQLPDVQHVTVDVAVRRPGAAAMPR